MKIRIGYGLGTQVTVDAEGFATLVDDLERLGFDSLWLSERVSGDAPDPLVGLAVAAGRTARLKLGTSVQVLPGRNPVLLAAAWASLDVLSGGRALPAFGLGVVDPAEQQAFGVAADERASWFDEALPLIRRLWAGEAIDHDGEHFSYRGVQIRPRPIQSPPDVWLGGRAPSGLRRIGRLGDGWLASFQTPAQVVAGRAIVEEAAAAAGREIDPEHYGAMVFYSRSGIPDQLAEAVARRNPRTDPAELIATGIDGARALCERFVDVGFSKLVLAGFADPADRGDDLEEIAETILPMQT